MPDSTNSNLVPVTEPNLPTAASRIIFGAGLPPRRPADPARPPLGAELTVDRTAVAPGSPLSLTALLTNVDSSRYINDLKATVTAPDGWTVTPTVRASSYLPRTGTISPSWRVVAPSAFASPATLTLTVTFLVGADTYSLQRTVVLTPDAPVTTLSTFTNATMRFSQIGDTYSITGASGDTFDGFGIYSDTYGTVYQPAAAGVDSTTTARVVSYDRPTPTAKAGVVLRNDLRSPGSARGYAAIMVQAEGITVFDDPDGNGYFNHHQVDRSSPTEGPIYLRLVRSGAQVVGSWSTDGTTWVQVGDPITLNSPDPTLDAGMLWVTADPNAAGTATFDHFTVTTNGS